MNIFYECIFMASNFLKIHLFAVIDIEHIKCHKKNNILTRVPKLRIYEHMFAPGVLEIQVCVHAFPITWRELVF